MPNHATISVHTKPETAQRLKNLAELTRRSKSFLANDAIERYLDAEEAFITAIGQGLADVNAGRVIDHAKAKEYVLTLGTKDEMPFPEFD